MDVGYDSGGGPNHLKDSLVYRFLNLNSDQKILFIAASYRRGADHVVGLNLHQQYIFKLKFKAKIYFYNGIHINLRVG